MWNRNGLALGLFVGVALLLSGCQDPKPDPVQPEEPDRYTRVGCAAEGGYYREERQETIHKQEDDFLGWRDLRTIHVSRICDIPPKQEGLREQPREEKGGGTPGPLDEILDIYGS